MAVLGATLSPGAQAVTERTIRDATAVKERHEKSLFGLPAVVGVGVGASKNDASKAAIQIFVSRSLRRKERAQFPRILEGVPVDIVLTGPVQARPRR